MRGKEKRGAELAAVTLEECCYETPQPGALILPEMILNHCPKPHTLVHESFTITPPLAYTALLLTRHMTET